MSQMTTDQFALLQAIHNASQQNHPCPENIVHDAQPLIDLGWARVVRIPDRTGATDLVVTDVAKWKMIEAGFKLE